jgi:hypothetical protein
MANISKFQVSEFPKAEGLFSCEIGEAYVLTKCTSVEELSAKLDSGEFSLTPTKTGNSFWAGRVKNVNVDELKQYFKQRTTVRDAWATVFPQDVKAAAAF